MTRITISKDIEFDAGHRVPMHLSKCVNPHGHRYKVRVKCVGEIVESPDDPEHGMLTDFSALKEYLTFYVHDVLDHAMIVHRDDTVLLEALSGQGWRVVEFPYVPTAENLSRWIWEQLGPLLLQRYETRLRLAQIAVWETPTSVAYYEGD